MNKLLRVLFLLGIFLGLGVSCASAANVAVSFDPQTVSLLPGSSQSINISIDKIPTGLSGFNITVSIQDPGIAEITSVSSPEWNGVPINSTSKVPSSSVWIKAVNFGGLKAATNVSLGTITITGKNNGSTTISIEPIQIDDNNGDSIIPDVSSGKINVGSIPLPVNPVITWNNPANIDYGTALSSTQLNAVASVPGIFNYTPAEGTVLTVGTHILHGDFTPTDVVNYTNASKDVTINVIKIVPNPPTITWSKPTDITNGTSLTITQLNAVASVAGTLTYTPPAGTVLGVGNNQNLHVDFAPTDAVNYTTASKDVTINVIEKKIPTITWSNPADITNGTSLTITQLNAVASVAGTLTYTPPAGTVLGVGNNQNLHVDFAPTDAVNYTTASKDVKINVIDKEKKNSTITWSNPSNITYGTGLSNAQLNAVASVPGTLVYTPAAGTVLGVGVNILHVDFAPTDASNYTTASKDVTINVIKAPTTITWSNPADITNGTSLTITQLNAVASVAGTLTYTPPAGTVLGVGVKTLHVDFTPTDAVNYTTASKDVTINEIEKKIPTITWSNPADITNGTSLTITQLNAVASVAGTLTYTPPAGTVLGVGNNQNLHVDFAPTDAVNYTTASKDVKINVIDKEKKNSTITWSNPADITNGTALSSTQLNAVASVPGALVYTPAAGTVLPVGTHKLNVTFTPIDAVNYTTASKEVTINVNDIVKKTPTITWNNPADITSGNALGATQLNAVAKDPITGATISGQFVYNPAAGTVLPVGTHKLNVTFTPIDAVNYTTASKEVTIKVIEVLPVKPVKAAFDVTPTSGVAPLTVQFTDKSTNATSIKWDFGDKSGTSSSSKGSHIYTIAGIYTVTLTAYNGANSDVTTKKITVTRPVILKINAIKADATIGNAPLTVKLGCDVSGKPTSYIWTINKQTFKGGANGKVTYTFTKAGKYDVTLVVKDASRHSDSMTKKGFITVLPRVKPPVAAFSATPTLGTAPLTVQFTDKSQNKPDTWQWNFGDGAKSYKQSPSHKYKYPGKYSVTLTVKNKGGSDIKTIKNYIVVRRI